MKKTERIVHYFDASISAFAQDFEAPKPISVKDALKLIDLLNVSARSKAIQKGQQVVYIKDMKISPDKAVLLINKSDQTISDPVFTDLIENKRRLIKKETNEGQDFSIHLVIHFKKSDDLADLALCEYFSGITITTIQRLLNNLLRDVKKVHPEKFEFTHPDGSKDQKGKPKKYKVNYKFQFDAHISDEFANDLNHGKIHSIGLISKQEQQTPFDEDGYVREKFQSVTLGVDDEKTALLNKVKILKQVFKRHKENYSKAKIRFKSPEGSERTVDFDMETEAPNIENYIKKARIDSFNEVLQSSYESINNRIVEKISKLSRS